MAYPKEYLLSSLISEMEKVYCSPKDGNTVNCNLKHSARKATVYDFDDRNSFPHKGKFLLLTTISGKLFRLIHTPNQSLSKKFVGSKWAET
jgi:hypothetical protein